MRVSVPDAKAALRSQLEARPELADVPVHWGVQPVLPAGREQIMLLGVEDLSRTSRYQTKLRNETYTLPVLIEVHGTGEEQQPVERRAWELFDAFEEGVRDDPELGGSVFRAEITRVDEGEGGPTDQGWLVQLLARVGLSTEV